MDVNQEILRKQLMVSQFVNAVGVSPDQAKQILQAAHWHFEVSATRSDRNPPTEGRTHVLSRVRGACMYPFAVD